MKPVSQSFECYIAKARRGYDPGSAAFASNSMLTISEILAMDPNPDDLRHPPPNSEEILEPSSAVSAVAHYTYEREVLTFLFNNRHRLGIEKLYRFKNQSLDGELILQNGASVPFEIKFRMNWLKACQANWQFARFTTLTGRDHCDTGIVFFEEFSGDWAVTAKSRSIPNGWIRWYKEHYKLHGLNFHLVKLCNGQIETYSDVARS